MMQGCWTLPSFKLVASAEGKLWALIACSLPFWRILSWLVQLIVYETFKGSKSPFSTLALIHLQILVPSFPTKTTTSAKQLSSSFPEDSLPSTVAAVGNALLQWPFSCLSSSPSCCSWHSEAAPMPDALSSSAIPFRSISDFRPDEMKWPTMTICWPQCRSK